MSANRRPATRTLVALAAALAACRSLIGYDEGLPLDGSSVDGSADGSAAAAPPGSGAESGGSASEGGSNEGGSDEGGDFDASTSPFADAAACLAVEAGPLTTAPRSCMTDAGALANCGAAQNEDCCASLTVPGGSYELGTTTTTVSTFSLDKFEVTVGRMRTFVDAYQPDMIPPCTGKNPHNPLDPGWELSWNARLPNRDGVVAKLEDDPAYASFTSPPGAHETRPVNFANWYVAEAFCIWDGGRLPTYAEWRYTVHGGTDRRTYPWGNDPPGLDTTHAVYGCLYPNPAGSGCGGAENLPPVGSATAGFGKWGHADLYGSLMEWLRDWDYVETATCVDCATLTGVADQRLTVGGDFTRSTAYMVLPYIEYQDAVHGNYYMGFRCARNP